MPADQTPQPTGRAANGGSVLLRLGVSLASVLLFTRCFSFGSGPSGGSCGYQDNFNEDICGDEVVDDSFTVTNQQELAQLYGITFVDGSLTIENSTLTSLDDLVDLVCVRGNLVIADNDALTSIDGLQSLEQIGWNLAIENNDSLVALEGLSNLSLIDDIVRIEDNDALESLQGLSGLTSVRWLLIRNNDKLETLEGLTGLNAVMDGLEIAGNESLASLTGLEELSIMPTGELTISDHPELTALDGLENLEAVQRLVITDNASLVGFDGLDNLTEVTYNLWVFRNDSLIGLGGLSNLDHIGMLALWDNPALTSLHGLSDDLEIGSWDLERNPSLASLEGFEDLVPEHEFTAIQNTALPTCALVAYRDSLQSDGWEGEVCIYQNLEDECDDDESGCWWTN